ncbi:flavonoid 3',5'-hydroxylase-like [Telopea speciosissima]|uniref:flavonoid 3',5'-hydroxylase-like n=1 Tax=Telopea speciosissima TaxID=54955 RepID=UPI001CC74F81|nr:flavonoid 3',5'-hydroxylase-like [Telopea speciosissima]
MMRKVLVREMMSNSSLDLCYDLRRQEIQKMLREVYSKIGTPIDIGNLIFVTMLDMLMNMLWGGAIKREEKTRIGVEFRKMIGELVVLLGKTNVSDIFPILARFDLQGIERKAKEVFLWADTILDTVINERLKMEAEQEKKPSKDDLGSKDFLEILLEVNKKGDGKETLSMKQVKALLLDIVSAGTDTTTTTLEWAFAEIMQNPYIMRKAQEELGEVFGMSNRVEESHISKLPYLNAVVKETQRLHPVLPLLIPHCPSQSCTIGQFTIPKGSNVFLNIWKIHRDPEAWKDPLEFLPERFLGDLNEYDYKGNNFNYLPFGSGRRICAGIPLAERMSTYMLASLLHSFEWKLPENVELDLSEEFGLLLKKRTPLLIIPTPRLSNVELYN